LNEIEAFTRTRPGLRGSHQRRCG